MTPIVATVVAHSTPAPIPFRDESAGMGAHAMSVLGITSILLAVLWVVALQAKRRGWLARWLPAGAEAGAHPRVLLMGRLRLSPKTVLYEVMTSERERVLVAESASGVQLLSLTHTQGEKS